MSKTGELKDFQINVKIKLSALWVSLMFCYVYGDYFQFFVPGHIEGLMNGKAILDTPVKLLAAAILMAIPSLMVFLSLALKPKINRLLNFIFGVIYTLVMMLVTFISISSWNLFYTFFGIVEIIITVFIVWQALNWTRQENPSE
jgi:Family of unknown function (DUF6326)